MKVIVFVKATAQSEKGEMPTEQLMKEMGDYNEELLKAGILLSGEGLHPSSKGARVQFSGSQRSVVDGPFAETKELVAGFWIWQVQSMEEAVEWVKRCPNPMNEDSEIEIRPIFGPEDFGDAYTPELREQEDRMRAQLEAKPRYEVGRQRTIAGVKASFNAQTRDQIPSLWCDFYKLRTGLKAADDANAYGVMSEYQEDQSFSYLAGIEVSDSGQELPAGTETITLPAQRYAIFSHLGDVHSLSQTFTSAYQKWLPESGHTPAQAPCFERYGKGFDPETLSGDIEVWIPIKE